MKIELKLFANLSSHMPKKTGRNKQTMDVSEGTAIKELLGQLKVPDKAVKIIFLNGIRVSGDEILKEGDRVGVFPPVAGG